MNELLISLSITFAIIILIIAIIIRHEVKADTQSGEWVVCLSQREIPEWFIKRAFLYCENGNLYAMVNGVRFDNGDKIILVGGEVRKV